MEEQGILTKGRVAPTLLKFTLPILGANVLQVLYGLVDMIVVGQFASSSDLSAVSVSSLVFATITSLAIGMTAGGTVVIGNRVGAGDRTAAGHFASTMFCLYTVIALSLTVLFFTLAGPLLRLLNTPAEAWDQALAYLRICCGGLLFTFLYNAVSAVLRADGDSKHPLLFVAVACVFNILGDLLFVGVFRLQAAGAALATMLGQIMSFVVGVVYLHRHKGLFRFHREEIRMVPGCAGELLRVGIPMALQETLIMISFMILEAVINKMGVTVSAAAGVTDKLFTLAVLPSTAFSGSIAAMVAQNMGAGQPGRVRQCLRIGLGISFAAGVAVCLWLHLAPESALRIFTRDPEVIAMGCLYLTWYVLEYPMCSLAFPLEGLINGTGNPKYTMIINMISTFGVRVPLVLLLINTVENPSLLHIGIALPIASGVSALLAGIYVLRGNWWKKAKQNSPA